MYVLWQHVTLSCDKESAFHMSYSVNSLMGGYIGDNIGEYYRAYEGRY